MFKETLLFQRKLSIQIHKLLHKRISLQKISTSQTDHYLSLRNDLKNLYELNLKNQNIIQQIIFTANTPYYDNVKEKKSISLNLKKINHIYYQSITQLIKPELSKEIDLIIVSFIHPLKRYLNSPSKKNTLVKDLERLNMSWNGFNMKVTHETLKNKKSIKIIQKIHRRWNNILKVILKRW